MVICPRLPVSNQLAEERDRLHVGLSFHGALSPWGRASAALAGWTRGAVCRCFLIGGWAVSLYGGLTHLAQAQDLPLPGLLQVQLGVDSWATRSSAQANTMPGFIEEKTNLLLPNADPRWNYRVTSPYLKVLGEQSINPDLTLNVKASVDQFMGVRVDGFNLDWMLSPKLGVRAGVVEYKTNWCQTYDAASPWLRETNALCATQRNLDVTGGAPGVQVYTDTQGNDYLMQTSFGVYDPLISKYAPLEYGNVVLSNDFNVKSNKKWGATVNVISLNSGSEFRASFLRAVQAAWIPQSDILGESTQTYNMVFFGANIALSSSLRVELDFNQRVQRLNVNSRLSDDYNFNANTKIKSSTAMATYQINSRNILAASYSYNGGQIYDENIYNARGALQEIINPALSWPTSIFGMAWRYNHDKQYFFGLEYMHNRASTWTSTLASGLIQQNYPSSGSALGLRLGYTY